MLKAGDLACREDRRVRGVKIGKTRRDRGISHVCIAYQAIKLQKRILPAVLLLIARCRCDKCMANRSC